MQNKNRRTVGRVERESYNLEDGITLIALIITIVVMLILVAVSIQIVINSGLIESAKNAGKGIEDKAKEESTLGNEIVIDGKTYASIEEYVDYVNGKGKGDSDLPTVTAGKRADKNSKYTDENEDTAIIPADFTVSGVKTDEVDETTIERGLVIYLIPEGVTVDWEGTNENAEDSDESDENTGIKTVEYAQKHYDQFVWIPIAKENINDMYMCQSEDGTKSCRITVQEINGEEVAYCTTHESTQMAGRLYTTSAGIVDNSSETTQKYTVNSGYREPDVLTESNGTSYDGNTTYLGYLNGILGTSFASSNDFKTYLQEEYNEIVKSVYKNEGFYVGRYETSGLAQSTTSSDYKAKVVKGTLPSVEIDWYHMYAEQIKYVDNNNLNEESIGSTMIQGAAYDQIMKFVHVEGKYDVTTAGNVGHSSSGEYNTGSQSTDQSKNIFDLEGNVRAWTSEAIYTGNRVGKGGTYKYSYSACSRGLNIPYYPNGILGTLAQLYIK